MKKLKTRDIFYFGPQHTATGILISNIKVKNDLVTSNKDQKVWVVAGGYNYHCEGPTGDGTNSKHARLTQTASTFLLSN